MKQLTEQEAIALAETGWWKGKPAREVALFQLKQEKLCMDFGDFHKAVGDALGRPVWTHEFAGDGFKRMLKELDTGVAPSFEDIMNLIPAEKRVVVVLPDSN